jgi:hypothetical protein
MVGAPVSPAPPPRGARRQCFLMLMMGTPESPSAPPRGAVVDVFSIDGGRSRISVTAF